MLRGGERKRTYLWTYGSYRSGSPIKICRIKLEKQLRYSLHYLFKGKSPKWGADPGERSGDGGALVQGRSQFTGGADPRGGGRPYAPDPGHFAPAAVPLGLVP